MWHRWDQVIWYYENVGTIFDPQMALNDSNLLDLDVVPFAGTGTYGCQPDFFDIDNDGDLDVTISMPRGGIKFFRNITGDTLDVANKSTTLLPSATNLSFGPNPANPAGVARFQLHAASFVNLGVYDVTGRLVTPLASQFLLPGSHHFRWDAEHVTSGVYILHLRTDLGSQSRKVVALR
jgi:hypothetical protein